MKHALAEIGLISSGRFGVEEPNDQYGPEHWSEQTHQAAA